MKTFKQLTDSELSVVCGGDEGGVPNAKAVIIDNLVNAIGKSRGHALLGSSTNGLCNAVQKNAHNISLG